MRKEVTSERITARYLLYKMVGTGIQEEARQMYASLALLHQGIVSTNLVNYTQLDSSYNEVKQISVEMKIFLLNYFPIIVQANGRG